MNSTGPTGFLTLSAAAAQVGISRNTMADRVRAGEVPAYRDPRDKRFTLVRVADVDRLLTPRPVAATREDAVGAA